jgi:GTP 3',8-cyclase
MYRKSLLGSIAPATGVIRWDAPGGEWKERRAGAPGGPGRSSGNVTIAATALAPGQHTPLPVSKPSFDRFGRRIDYLRISLTDRCNLRCVYCMPATGMHFAPRDDLLTDEELLRVVRLTTELGFRKFRLTGGEPTVRPNLSELIAAIKAMPGVEEVALTTNAILLAKLAPKLAAAGLDRVNVSIDTLDADRFRRITRGGDIQKVWAGIAAAEECGLTPIKLNAVVVRGWNDHEVADLAGLTLTHPWQMRFIEIMPLDGVFDVANERLVPSAESRALIQERWGALTPEPHVHLADPARPYRLPGAQGTVGFISSVTENFCAGCNRMRLTSDGKLRLCLLRADELDLRPLLRAGVSDAELRASLREGVWRKPWGHGLKDGILPVGRGMSQIGG